MHQGIFSLWSLLEACRAGDPETQRAAADAAAAAVRETAHGCDVVTLALAGGGLSWGGAVIARGIEDFAALQCVAATLRSAGASGVRMGCAVTADDLLRWARLLIDGEPAEAWPAPFTVLRGGGEPASYELTRSGSRLGSMFLLHRLVAALPHLPGVDPAVARLVVQGVVDRLQQLPAGLEPLMLLQQDAGLLQRALRTAVFSVLFARAAGWPSERLGELGAVALLHDVGSALDPSCPALAGFRWLLERGEHDFWLRSALVARRWRAEPGAPGSALVGEQLAAIVLVRLAVAAGAEADPVARVRRMRDLGVTGAVPLALVTAALEVCQVA